MITQAVGLPLASGGENRNQSERDPMKNVLEHLKTERLSRGWTLQDVSDRTGISITVLKALESGNSDKLVAPSAVDGLLRKYSTALKAQTEQIADRPQKTTVRDGPRSRKTFRYIMKGSLLSAVFAAVFLGSVFRQTWETKDSSVKSHEPAVSQTETTPSITSEQETSSGHEDLPPQHRELPEVEKQPPGSSPPDVTPSTVPKAEQDAIPPAGPDEKSVVSIQPPVSVRPAHSLEITADQRTWIQVVVDGRNTETELLEAGETRKWQAMDKVDLVVGNGGGVSIRWDGKPVEISSRRGRVVRLTLPKP
jgi:cytoskeleton protein RodZ